MGTSIRDIARQAGVSVTTVSHVLNGTRFVSDQLRGKVLKAVRDLGYQPNELARSLRTRRTHALGLVVSDTYDFFFMGVSRGVEERARELGYNVILAHSAESLEREAEVLRVLVQNRVEGILLTPTAGRRHPEVERVVAQNVPLVTFNRRIPGLLVPAVVADDEAGSYAATRHLIQHGYYRIAAITGLPGTTTSHNRLRGYVRALQERGIRVDRRLIVSGRAQSQQAYDAVQRLLALPRPPQALFAFSDRMTLGAMRALRDAGLRCPEDVALIGHGEFEGADAFKPGLSLVSLPHEHMGAVAVDLLVRRIQSPGYCEKVVLPAPLVTRESCGCALDGRKDMRTPASASE